MFYLLFLFTLTNAQQISYWHGKVNQHYDISSKTWVSDPDKTSGDNIDKLEYCQKWYSSSISWRDTSTTKLLTFCNRNEDVCTYKSQKSIYDCLPYQETTERISYWYGKVNQHYDISSKTWISDPDKTSGAEIPMLEYCQKWWPQTIRVEDAQTTETINFCNKDANTCNNIASKHVFKCIQPVQNCCDTYSCFTQNSNTLCCRALTAACLSCQAGVSADTYCSVCPNTIGCPQSQRNAMARNCETVCSRSPTSTVAFITLE